MSSSEDGDAIYGNKENQPGSELGGKIRRLVLSLLGLRYLWKVLSKQLTIIFQEFRKEVRVCALCL